MALAHWSNLMLSVPVDITALICTWYAEECSNHDQSNHDIGVTSVIT